MRTHHTKNKGDLGVLKSQLDLYEKGYMILTPNTEHSPFDLVAYKGGKFLRIQVKYRSAKNEKIEIPFSTCWSDKNGTHTQPYDKNEIDVMCVYCPDTDKCYYVDPKECKNTFNIRLSIPKNNQKSKIHMADDYLNIPEIMPLDKSPIIL
jgi:hypothetical protein